MRPMRYACGILVSVAIGTTGCGGSDGGTDPGPDPGGGGNPTIVTPSTAEKNAVAGSLSAIATRVGQSDVVAQQLLNALALVMQTTTTATEMDVTTNLDVIGGVPGSAASYAVSAASAMATRRVLGYSVTFNLQPGQRTTRGVIVWDAAGAKVMATVFGNANVLNVTYPSFGNAAYLASSQTQVWEATEGSASWTVFPGGTAQCTGTMPSYVGSCGYEDGRAPFTVSASEPVVFNGSIASGSRTAVLSNAQIRVLFLGIGCGIPGAPC
jgi:hypothetical protein